MWEFFSQGIWPFAAGFGLGFLAAGLLAVPSIAAALAKIKIGDIPGQEKLSERKREAVDELVAALALHGPAGARPERDTIGKLLNSPCVNSVIAIGDDIAAPVQALIRAFDKNDEAEFARAVEDCHETCRYVQLVDSVSGNAVATFSMKMVARLALAADKKANTLRTKFRRWRMNRQNERKREELQKTVAARAIRIPQQSTPAPPPPATANPAPPGQMTTTTSSPNGGKSPP